MSRRRWVISALSLVLVVLLLGAGGFVIWAQTPLGPMPEALAALETDSAVRVEAETTGTNRGGNS